MIYGRGGAVPRTIYCKRVPKRERARRAEEIRHLLPLLRDRPKTRGDCKDGPRPCPWVACKHHLATEVLGGGSIKIFFPIGADPDQIDFGAMEETCSLDVADRGGVALERVGELMAVTRERVRQIEGVALEEMERQGVALKDLVDP